MPKGIEQPAVTLVLILKHVSSENLHASFHARIMPAEDRQRHSSCVRVFVKLQDIAHQNPENRESVGLSS